MAVQHRTVGVRVVEALEAGGHCSVPGGGGGGGGGHASSRVLVKRTRAR